MSSITAEALDKREEHSLKQLIAGIQLGYGIPTLLLMLYLFFHLGWNPKYKNSFYRLVQVDLLINMLFWISSWFVVRSLDFPSGIEFIKTMENSIPGIFDISGFFVLVFYHMQFCSAASMSVHRISSILFFSKYERFWSRFYLLIYLCFAIYSCIPQLLGPAMTLKVVNNTACLYTDHDLYFISARNFAILTVIYFCLIFGLAITVACTAYKKLQYTLAADQGVSKKLTKIAMTYGYVYSGLLIWTGGHMSQYIFDIPQEVIEIGYSLMSLAMDMMTLSLPYILLIFDTNIKQDLRHPRQSSASAANAVAPSLST